MVSALNFQAGYCGFESRWVDTNFRPLVLEYISDSYSGIDLLSIIDPVQFLKEQIII